MGIFPYKLPATNKTLTKNSLWVNYSYNTVPAEMYSNDLKGIFMKTFKVLSITFLTLTLLSPALLFGFDNSNLKTEFVILDKPEIVITQSALNYLGNQKSDKVKVWVFFNDKGIYNQTDFETAASKIEFNENTASRRAKVNMDKVVFADLPVYQAYINDITGAGGELRRESKWLNAASFEIDFALLNNIADLSFVNRIKPVAWFHSVQELESGIESKTPEKATKDATALDYGTSWTQIFMIYAYILHSMGFNGQGVVVAMLDTGYRKSHEAFAQAYADSRVLAEYDFINDDGDTQNETGDDPSQHFHGTYCWSTLGGYSPGEVIGPAYGASFILAKTEDVTSETPVEEDNWVAALEWVDSIGADVISTSLSYSDWYTYEDFDGNTATTTLAANTAAALGIVICNSLGNSGPDPGTLGAPGDAYDVLSCGAVNSSWSLADFSSRGPTYDGRTKPEVCAMGVSTYCATASGDSNYDYKNGTSLSTPLVGGGVALLLSANPSLTPYQVMDALKSTANNASSPDNNYGWGIINLQKAYDWGANFTADTTIGSMGLTVSFTDSSTYTATSWKWYFGDGDSAMVQNPSHTYLSPGSFDVTLIIEYTEGTLTRIKEDFVHIIADSLRFSNTSAKPGDTAVMSVNLYNTQNIHELVIPVYYGISSPLVADHVTLGGRTIDFESLEELYRHDLHGQLVFEMIADDGGGTSPMPPGDGEIAEVYFVVNSSATIGDSILVSAPTIESYNAELTSLGFSYAPDILNGYVIVATNLRGDANNSGDYNIFDITYLINFLYLDGQEPVSLFAADANADSTINIFDATYLISFLYLEGPPPPE